MAEFGVAAGVLGVVGVAGQLLDTIIKIRRFCKDVQHAPQELQDALAEIERMSKWLERLKPANHNATEHSQTSEFSLRSCQASLAPIAKQVQELRDKMARHRRRAAMQMVMKQEEIDRLLQKLDRTKMELFIAHQLYSDEQREMQMNERFERLCLAVQEMQALHSGDVDEDEAQSAGRNPRKQTTKDPLWPTGAGHTWSMEYHVRFPSWLCQRAFEISLRKSTGCWTSVFTGAAGLALAASSGNTPAAKYLIASGASVEWRESWYQSSVVRLPDHCPLPLPNRSCMQSLNKFFGPWAFDHFESDASRISTELAHEYIRAHAQFLLGNWDDHHGGHVSAFAEHPSQRSPLQHLGVLEFMDLRSKFKATKDGESISAWIFDTLGNGLGDLDIIQYPAGHAQERGLLHTLASIWINCMEGSEDEHDVASMIRQVVCGGADIHAGGALLRSPLWSTIRYYSYNLYHMRKFYTTHVQRWAALLQSAGIDLLAYGAVESELYRFNRDIISDGHPFWPFHAEKILLDIRYGPVPRDWGFYLREPGNAYAGAFWNLVENPKHEIPGTWLDDADEEYDCDGADSILNSSFDVRTVKRRSIRKARALLKKAKKLGIACQYRPGQIQALLDVLAKIRPERLNGGFRGWSSPELELVQEVERLKDELGILH